MKLLKWILITLLLISIVVFSAAYFTLRSSLPALDGNISSSTITENASLKRDQLGTAVIEAKSEYDAAYILGYAQGQDRLFQMDLLRRQSAGELSALVGSVAIETDKRHRFHQLKKHATNVLTNLSTHEKKLLESFTHGVNDAAASLSSKPFEYYLLGAEFKPWQAIDSLMVTYSMYIDLQRSQTEIDFALTALYELYGTSMYEFFTLPSNYQAAIDYSSIPSLSIEIPILTRHNTPQQDQNVYSKSPSSYDSISELPDFGSNNWAVAKSLTKSNSALLSNDMHLGLRVPAIWYRAQLNYVDNGRPIQVTGMSLPGTPAVIVGANGAIAWGFTNANVDNVDWIKLSSTSPSHIEQEQIEVANGDAVSMDIEISEFGPIRHFEGERYALKWVAHQDYAVNMRIADMAKMQSVDEALALSKQVRIPVQNMVVADAAGDVAWQLTGAVSGRTPVSRKAIDEVQYDDAWLLAETEVANQIKPENGRVWSANARVVGVADLARFGDGGYALGARQHQIMTTLMENDSFDEQSFYDLQLDNRALFLMPWHNLLVRHLENSPQKYAQDIEMLNNWQACACADSVAYTMVRRFRSTLINQLLAPISTTFKDNDLSASYLLRSIEPAIWIILQNKNESWLPPDFKSYDSFILNAYTETKQSLFEKHNASNSDMKNLVWGKVNALKVEHPFAAQLSFLGDYFNMPEVAGFGDSFMPAVQADDFGASQRLIVQPGNMETAILTIPGGQSGHVLSPFFRTGFADYAEQKNTPLLPSETEYTLQFSPSS